MCYLEYVFRGVKWLLWGGGPILGGEGQGLIRYRGEGGGGWWGFKGLGHLGGGGYCL